MLVWDTTNSVRREGTEYSGSLMITGVGQEVWGYYITGPDGRQQPRQTTLAPRLWRFKDG